MRLAKEFIRLVVENYLNITAGQNRQVAKYVIENLTPQERHRVAENALKIYYAARGI